MILQLITFHHDDVSESKVQHQVDDAQKSPATFRPSFSMPNSNCNKVQWLRASHWHLCASVNKQYNLALVKRRWCSAAGKVTVGLVTTGMCHRLCGLSIYGLKAHVRETSATPKFTTGHSQPLPFTSTVTGRYTRPRLCHALISLCGVNLCTLVYQNLPDSNCSC